MRSPVRPGAHPCAPRCAQGHTFARPGALRGAPLRAPACTWAQPCALRCSQGRTLALPGASGGAPLRAPVRPAAHPCAPGCAQGRTFARSGAPRGAPLRAPVRPWAHPWAPRGAQGRALGRTLGPLEVKAPGFLCCCRRQHYRLDSAFVKAQSSGPFFYIALRTFARSRTHLGALLRAQGSTTNPVSCTRRAARLRLCALRAYTCALRA